MHYCLKSYSYEIVSMYYVQITTHGEILFKYSPLDMSTKLFNSLVTGITQRIPLRPSHANMACCVVRAALLNADWQIPCSYFSCIDQWALVNAARSTHNAASLSVKRPSQMYNSFML